MTSKELQQEIITNMKRWQKVEDNSIASTGQIMQETDNPIIRLVVEIIQRDSQMHHTIQGWIADSLEYKAASLSPDELAKVGHMIERHLEIENKMIESAEEMLTAVKGKAMLAQQYFLDYLLEDERKHSHLLTSLQTLAKGMQP